VSKFWKRFSDKSSLTSKGEDCESKGMPYDNVDMVINMGEFRLNCIACGAIVAYHASPWREVIWRWERREGGGTC
jgi:hypothetical protein